MAHEYENFLGFCKLKKMNLKNHDTKQYNSI
jgi:hypothetical protein